MAQEWIVRTGGEISAGYEGAIRLLPNAAPEQRPTGIVCYIDRVAAGVLHAAARLGIVVPDDLSVVGYDDQEHMAAYLTPPLSTVALPHRLMGESAARLLLDAIDAGTPRASRSTGRGVRWSAVRRWDQRSAGKPGPAPSTVSSPLLPESPHG